MFVIILVIYVSCVDFKVKDVPSRVLFPKKEEEINLKKNNRRNVARTHARQSHRLK